MKTKILAALAAGLLSSTAMAADLPSRRVAPAPIVAPVPVFTWTGFYAGLQAGASFDKYTFDNSYSYWGAASTNRTSFVGGGHVGYLFQPIAGPIVLGVEAQVEGRTGSTGGIGGAVLGRIGAGFDRALIYATGGLAWQNYKINNYSGWWSNSYDKTQTGWTVGAGVEYALTNNWSARIEYRYSDFGRIYYGWGYPQASVRPTSHSVRLGVSYHFNTGYAGPVVAKY